MVAIVFRIDTGTGMLYELDSAGWYSNRALAAFEKALGFPLSDVNGELAEDMHAPLMKAYHDILANPQVYEEMIGDDITPTVRGAAEYLRLVADIARLHPDSVLEVSTAELQGNGDNPW